MRGAKTLTLIMAALVALPTFSVGLSTSAPVFANYPLTSLSKPALTFPTVTNNLSLLPGRTTLAPTVLPIMGTGTFGNYGGYGYTGYGSTGFRPAPITIAPGMPQYNPYLLFPQQQYMMPPQNNNQNNMMMLMMLPMMMSAFSGGGMGGGFGGSHFGGGGGSYGGYGGGYGGGGYASADPVEDVGGSGGGYGRDAAYSGQHRYGSYGSRNNTPGDLGVDTSGIDTSQVSRNCAAPNHGEFNCMVCNCYFEAGDEPYAGKVEVGRVVITRKLNVAHFHRHSLCGVIYAYKQFSWTLLLSRKTMTDGNQMRQCIAASKESLVKGADGYDHYHATYVSPSWRYNMRQMKRIGRHIFYSQSSLAYANQGADPAVASAADAAY